MFTGIVEARCPVREVERRGGGRRLLLEASGLRRQPVVSESVSVNGICLTVSEVRGDCLAFDIVEETCDRSTLGDLRPGLEVNVETSLRVGDPLGGHFVTGHVDGLAELVESVARECSTEIRVRPPWSALPLIAEKGSVALDGVSLTVADVGEDSFRVAIVPHTLDVTTLSGARVGHRFNLELDILARYVARLAGRT